MKKKSVFAILATAVIAAHAADVSWTGGGDDALWTNPANWGGGAEPPSETNLVVTASGSATMDLGGKTVSISTWGESRVPITLRNGTLILENGATGLQGTNKAKSEAGLWDSGQFLEKYTTPFTLAENAHLIVRTKFNVGDNRNGGYLFEVNDGTSLTLDNVSMVDRLSFIKVLPGGNVSITCNSEDRVQKGENSTVRSTWANDGGDFSFPNGFVLKKKQNSGWGPRASFRIQQNSGKMILGGPISLGNFSTDTSVNAGNNGAGLYFQWYGGEIVVTNDVSFNCLLYFPYTSSSVKFENYTGIFADSVVTANVEVAKTMDLTGLPILGDGVSMTKKGLGTVVMGATVPDQMSVEAGSVKFSNGAVVQDASWLTFANGSVMYLDGISVIDTAPNGTPSYAYADYSSVAINSVLISSTDSALLTAIKSSILASGDFPSTLSLESTDGALVVTSNYTFNHETIQDLNDPNGWQCGSVPEGQDVSVSGANVTAILNAQTPVFNSISVANGATLKVEGEVTLPSIKLSADSRMVISPNATARLNELSTKAEADSLSIFEIASGAVVQTSQAELIFTDVDLRLNGVIQNTAANANVYLGYADVSGAQFALSVNGGSFANADGASIKNLYFMKAENGGYVSAAGDSALTLKAMDFSAVEDIRIGEGNPEDLPFDFVLDNTSISMNRASRDLFIRGASRVHLRNGARIDSGKWDIMSVSHLIAMSQSASLIVEENGLVSKSVGSSASNDGYNTGRGQFAISATTKGHDSVVLKEGGIFRVYGTGGNGKSRVVADGGIWQYYRDHWGESGATDIFKGFTEVHVNEGKTLTIQCAKPGTIQDWGWTRDRHATIANVPITGTGDVVIDNEADTDIFECTLTCGNNTATGSLVMNPNKKATLFFKNGCNWVGKVVANGATQFTGDTAAEVTFGSVDLQAEFPLRVLGTYDEETKTATITGNDKVNITGSEGWINNGGQIAVQFPEAFTTDALPVNARIPLGTIPINAQLPTVRRADHLVVYTEAIEGDAEHLTYGLKPNRGFVIIFK